MNKERALETLFSALNVAQSKGAYTIKESAILFSAIQFIETNQPETVQTQDNSKTIKDNITLISKLQEEKQDLKYKLQDQECDNENLIRKIKKLEKQIMVVPQEVRLNLKQENETANAQ